VRAEQRRKTVWCPKHWPLKQASDLRLCALAVHVFSSGSFGRVKHTPHSIRHFGASGLREPGRGREIGADDPNQPVILGHAEFSLQALRSAGTTRHAVDRHTGVSEARAITGEPMTMAATAPKGTSIDRITLSCSRGRGSGAENGYRHCPACGPRCTAIDATAFLRAVQTRPPSAERPIGFDRRATLSEVGDLEAMLR